MNYLYIIPNFYNFNIDFFFGEKINKFKVLGLISCLVGVLIIIIKGNFNLLLNLSFTKGDLWMLQQQLVGLCIQFCLLLKSELQVFPRFTIISFGRLCLYLFIYLKNFIYFKHNLIKTFSVGAIYCLSPGIIAFALYTLAQQKLGASVTGFTLYLFTVYGAFYGIFLFDEVLQIYHYV